MLFKAFFGCNKAKIKRTVIISPVIYPKQLEKLTKLKGRHYKSTLSYLVANFKDFTFIKTPMTQAAVTDLTKLLPRTKCKEIIFIGAIGGLQKAVKIGDVFASSKPADFYSFKSIHDETDTKLKALQKKGVVGIDFEARPFFRAAKKARLKAFGYFLVTDLPLCKPFYKKKTIKEKLRVQGAIAFIANLLTNDQRN